MSLNYIKYEYLWKLPNWSMFWEGDKRTFFYFGLFFFPLECTSVGLNCIDSVHLLLCNNLDDFFPLFFYIKYGCVGMMWTCLPWYCCPSHPHLLIWPLQPSVEVGVSDVIQTIPGGTFRFVCLFVFFSPDFISCVFRGQGVKKMQSHSTQ